MIHDHHTQARLYALRGYARRADRLDGRSDREMWFALAGMIALGVLVLYVVTR